MKKIIAIILSMSILIISPTYIAFASDDTDNMDNTTNNEAEMDSTSGENLEIKAKSAVLMEAETGAILYAKNASEPLAPASVTKIMTLLLVAEAIDSGAVKLTDTVTVSANATSKGGSQIFMKEGEQFTVEELLKSTVIASANDAAVALAEHLAGTETEFVSRMNKRAGELGMKSSVFENCTGLDDTVTNHKTSAYDIALMSRELILHDEILKYSNVWQDSIRDGEFVLTNTNRLVRYYQGCTGLKTGSTDKAGFCVSATAKRDGMHLIAVIMGSETRDERNEAARALLDFGFASYTLYEQEEAPLERIPVYKGQLSAVTSYSQRFICLVNKADMNKVEKKYTLPEHLEGEHKSGEAIGQVTYYIDGKEIGVCDVIIKDDIDMLTFFDVFLRILKGAVS